MNIKQLSDDDLLDLTHFDDIKSEMESRGFKYGWYKPTKIVGYIYVMVNPLWKDVSTGKTLVKIGYADNLAKRVRDFSGTGYPEPSHCYASYGVSERLTDKEVHRLIDGLDSNLRYDDKKEFYTMTPERAYGILSSIAKISGTEKNLVLNPLNDDYFKSDDGHKLDDVDDDENAEFSDDGKFNFSVIGVPIGAELTWYKDSSIVCRVKDSKSGVTYNGADWKLGGLTAHLLSNPKYSWGASRWNYNGQNLWKMFKQKDEVDHQPQTNGGYHTGHHRTYTLADLGIQNGTRLYARMVANAE